MAASGVSAGGPKVDAYRAGFARSDIVTKVCDKLYTPLFAGLFGERFPTIRYNYNFMMECMNVQLKQMGDRSVDIKMSETYYDKKYEIYISSRDLFGAVTTDSLDEKLVRSIIEEHPDVFREFFYFSKRVFSDTRELSVILEEAVLPPSAAVLVEHMTAPSTKVGFEEHMKALYAKVAVEHERTRDVEQARGLEEAKRVYNERQRKLVASGGAGGGASASSLPAPAPAPTSPYGALKEALRTTSSDGASFIVGNEFRDAKPPYLTVTVDKGGKKSLYKIILDDFSIGEFFGIFDKTPEHLAALEAIVRPFRPPAKDASRRSARKRRTSRRTNRRKGTRQRSSKK